jgi:hypothetical protein
VSQDAGIQVCRAGLAWLPRQMTLIVAAATEKGPRVLSDTHVLPSFGATPTYRTNALKAVILSPDTCVCFAGEVAAGLTGVRQASRHIEDGDTPAEVVAALQRVIDETQRDVEFLVARCGGDWQLARVRGDGAETDLMNAWIGDREAFERFQEARHAYTPPSYAKDLSSAIVTDLQLREGMTAVLEEPQLPSVADFLVSVACLPDGFNYLDSMFTMNGRDVTITIPSGQSVPIPWSTSVADGSYTVSIVAPADPGIPALALLFPFAQFALLFLPLRFDEVQVITGFRPEQFVDRVREDFGITMHEAIYPGNKFIRSDETSRGDRRMDHCGHGRGIPLMKSEPPSPTMTSFRAVPRSRSLPPVPTIVARLPKAHGWSGGFRSDREEDGSNQGHGG